jgi:hypothetical protein
MLVLWCPLSGIRKDIIMKDDFVIFIFYVNGLNFLGQLLHENYHKCGKMKLQFHDQKTKNRNKILILYMKNWFAKASQ